MDMDGKQLLSWMESEKARIRQMSDHDRSIVMAEKIINIEAWQYSTGKKCDDHGDEIAIMKTYWHVTIGILVFLLALIVPIIWDLLKGGS